MKKLIVISFLITSTIIGCGGDYIPTAKENIFMKGLSKSLDCTYNLQDNNYKINKGEKGCFFISLNFSYSEKNYCKTIDNKSLERIAQIITKHFMKIKNNSMNYDSIKIEFSSSDYPSEGIESPSCGKSFIISTIDYHIIELKENII